MDNMRILPKVLLSHRQNLGEAVPLRTPFVIEIGVCSFCNLKCKFCFHYNNDFKKHMMALVLFKKIVDDFREFPDKLKKFKICGYGENLLHPRFMDMLNYVVQSGITEYVELTTNGILLTKELGEALTNAGLKQINISVEAVTDEGYFEIAGKKIDVDSLAANIKYLFDYKTKVHSDLLIYTKIIDKNLKNTSEEEKFYNMFASISDYVFVEHLIDMWLDDSNETISGLRTDQNVYGLPLKKNEVCSFVFTRFIIHADGICVPCCSDWNRQYIIGDLKAQSAFEIWNSEALRKLRLAHLQHTKNIVPMCNGCRVYDLNSADNLDGYEEVILSRMSENAR
jgi:radical SAM protein with 4Fe4S-binding SPASM domain